MRPLPQTEAPVGADAPVYDVIVAGSGAGGLSAAVTAASAGLSVIVVEKEDLLGGTTARSGGVLWVPGNRLSRESGIVDSAEQARTYLKHEAGNHFDPGRVDAFLENGPKMVDFMESKTDVRFVSVPEFSDYHPDAPGALSGGRSIVAAPYDAGRLGKDISSLRPPLREITFVGMMFNASKEVSHFFNVTRSPKSAVYVAKRLLEHSWEMIRYGRAQRLTNGNALAARLIRSALDSGVELWRSTAALRVLADEGKVCGLEVVRDGKTVQLRARYGVVLATGGFPQDRDLRRRLFPHAPTGSEHWSPAPPGNVGDGWRMAEAAGGSTDGTLPNSAAWIPVSLVPRRDGSTGTFPHLLDRYKPGIVAVNSDGRRFVNEANSYHDFGQAMQQDCRNKEETAAWLVCDHRALRRYGLGFAKPFPIPVLPHLQSGYLLKGSSLRELASKAGIDPDGLEAAISAYNGPAARGEDPEFGKGATAYNRFLGDATHKPNPCVAPLTRGPFYAVKLVLGDLGTFAGIRTDERARVLDGEGRRIPGLYAVGNDALSVMGGSYPGGGITIGPAMTFGFIAGRDMAAAARENSENVQMNGESE
tara:strand:- start:39965 stop:41734 length:1770 start_codon:yes stop_codon:yes gene_type:complete